MNKDVVEALNKPFPNDDVEWRVGRKFAKNAQGKCTKAMMLSYVDSRAIQERLDEIFGKENWVSSYVATEKGVLCTLTCRTGADTIVKSDGSDYTAVSPFKGGVSGALRRTASVLGIGRYLYRVGDVMVNLDEYENFKGKIILPDEFLPAEEHTGNDKIKIVYANAPVDVKKGEKTEEVEAALNFVIRGDKFNSGKKMSEVFDKNLKFLANGRDTEQAHAAKIVMAYKGIA